MAISPFPARRRRSPILPPWLRPHHRRFKPPTPKRRPFLLRNKGEALHLRSSSLSSSSDDTVKVRPALRDNRSSDLPFPNGRSYMQQEFYPAEGVFLPTELKARKEDHRGKLPIKEREYPGLFRPATRRPQDLRELIRSKMRPPSSSPPLLPVPPTLPPTPPGPPPPYPWTGTGPIQFYGPRAPTEAQHLPSWADPHNWAVAQLDPVHASGDLFPHIMQDLMVDSANGPGRRFSNFNRLQVYPTIDRRTWAPGEIKQLDPYVYQDRNPGPPRFTPRIATGPWTGPPGQLFERGRIPMGPASRRQWVTGPTEELEDPGRVWPGLGRE